jgi:hypothetical protein
VNRVTVAQAETVYRVARHGIGHRLVASHSISDATLRHFALGLREFEYRLGPAAEDQFWIPLLRRLKRHRFEWSAAPLPFNHESFGSADTDHLFDQVIASSAFVYPDHVQGIHKLQGLFSEVAGSQASPMGDAMSQLLRDRPEMSPRALLISASRLLRDLQARLMAAPDLSTLELVTPLALAAEVSYDLLVVIGAPTWFPPHVFSAPRAYETHLLHYDWMRVRIDKNSLFLSSSAAAGPEAQAAQPPDAKAVDRDATTGYLQADDVLPKIDWLAISNNLAPAHEQGDVASIIEARLVLLANGFGAFLDTADHAAVYVIDPEASDLQRIRRAQTAEIAPGMYVLLRSEGGGDYVASLANHILGERAARLRGIQHEWKELLRQKVRASGISQVSGQLRELGLLRASEGNLRNWMSAGSLRTEDPTDFNTLMRFLGLQAQSNAYWEAMEILDRAHRKAGFHIRRLLIREVLQADFRQLEREGQMDFELADADGGSLTAFRVEQVSPDSSRIAHFRVGRPFEVERDLWQG